MKKKLLLFLKNYYSKRKLIKIYENLIDIGYQGDKNIKGMVRARFLKPSESKIDKAIKSANEHCNYLIKLSSKDDIMMLLKDENITVESLEQLKTDKLAECRNIYRLSSKIGMTGQNSMSPFYLMPIKNITVAELTIIIAALYIAFKTYIALRY
ncbi:hypothetical protein [uncultured Clostridium sp.]|uniref:hypothetical protein n=1 Tax=uncultured Clostridium sp. TaxID=59620 RepID=UPI0028E87BC1|nr:hypothetical protein [uncultured Clostridium sp.]